MLTLAIINTTAHRAMTQRRGDLPIRDFLISVTIQVLPICALKFKLVSSSNRLALLSRTASKVLFMHISVLTLRVTLVHILRSLLHVSSTVKDSEYDSPLDLWVHAFMLVSAIYIMSIVCEFRWTVVEFMGHFDIAVLHILGAIHVGILLLSQGVYDDVVAWAEEYTNSMEMLAYMPAAWMMAYTNQKLLAFEPLSQVVSQRQAIWFLAWIAAFSTYEDFIAMSMSGVYEPHFVAGHILHFLTLLDFSLLFLQQAYSSKVAKTEAPPAPKHLGQLS